MATYTRDGTVISTDGTTTSITSPGTTGTHTYNYGAPIVKSSEDDLLTRTANDLGLRLDEGTKDAIVQYILSEKGAENAQARSLEFNREQYSALVEGLKRAGLNPFLAIQGLNGANMMSGQSQSSGKYAELQVAKTQRETQAKTSILSAALMAIALVVAHAL